MTALAWNIVIAEQNSDPSVDCCPSGDGSRSRRLLQSSWARRGQYARSQSGLTAPAPIMVNWQVRQDAGRHGPYVGRALQLMQPEPARAWSLQDFAQQSGPSRITGQEIRRAGEIFSKRSSRTNVPLGSN